MLRAKCLRETWEETHRLVGRMRRLCAVVEEESVVWVLEKSRLENFKIFRVGLACESILTDLKTLQATGSD